ncbi:MAG: hypothetical protein IIA19_08815 [Thaumarchaeota archaeon]|nr:hypothetical protein [Nitrososphaerota archaeon]
MSDENQIRVEKILALDENIRFVAISDLDGNLIVSKSKEGVELYLSPESTKDTLRHAASAWKSRMKHVDEIGRGLYTIAVYEKLRRVTMPLSDDRILLVTIDNAGGQKQILDALLNEVVYRDYTYTSG